MTTLLLLRHGEVPGISPPKFRGRLELELTDRGREQARRTGERVHAGWPKLDALYCSPRHRTVATAQAVGKTYGMAPQALPEFDDLDYGDWHGFTEDETKQRWPDLWAVWVAAPEYAAFPGGETLAGLAARAWQGVIKILQANNHASVIGLVAHDSVNRVLLMQFLGMHLRFYRALAQDPCCLNVIEAPGVHAQVRLLNSTEHLRDL